MISQVVERPAWRINGFVVLLGGIALIVAAWVVFAYAAANQFESLPAFAIIAVVTNVVTVLVLTGLTVVSPNESMVVQFFGKYVGSLSDAGFMCTVPLSMRKRISLRVKNFETAKLKVNDADGNPVEIAAVVVYRVVETARAAFAVDDYEQFVAIQSEAAVRHLATTHPYDAHDERTSLRDGAEIASELTTELRDRTSTAGVEVIETRITHLAYAPEIAQAMLVRQQARQVVAARTTIVEGAVGMVGLALDQLSARGVVELDEERKAAMVSNLLVVLCGDRSIQPVVNTGTLYS